MGALMALLVSIAFTLLAVRCPHAANVIAVPIFLCVIALIAWHALRGVRA